MGDYVKLIVNCEVKVDKEQLEKEINKLSLGSSAYHCDGVVESIKHGEYTYNKDFIKLSLIGQTKWGNGQNEFLEWLTPFVKQGSGRREIFAIQIDEYTSDPKLWALHTVEETE